MKAIRPLLSLVIAMSLAPIAGAQAPATDAPVLTREFPDDLLRVPLSEAFPGLSLSNDLNILTKDGESYGTRFETLHKTIEPLCHVATLPTSHAIVERCSKNPGEQVTVWRRFIASLLQGNHPITKPSNRPDAASGIYLIDESGKTLTPVTRESLPKALLKDKSSAPPLSVSFDPPCKFPATPTGAKVAKLCTKSLPLPPVSASVEGDTLVLKRLQNEAAEAFISFGQEPEAPRVLINLWAAGTNFCIAGGKRYKDNASLNWFRSSEVPFGKQCERVALTCKARNWLDGEVVVDVNQFSGSCKVQKPKSCALEGRTVAERRTIAHGATLPLFRASEAPVGERCQRLVRKCENGVMTGDDAFRFSSCSDTQACTFDKKTIKDKGTIDAYKLNVVDSSTGRKCSEPTNMMRLTCTNGQLSAPKDWTSFPFSTCTARPMPGCNVNDKTQPLGYRTIPHGDTREVFTSATAPRGSNCASVKKTAQCLNARMWVDGVATAAFTQFFSNCTDPAPGGPGGIAPGYDGHCDTEELPDVEGQDPVYVPKCTDPDCSGKGPCPEGPGTNGSAEDCTDGIDNDGDGSTDCADGDCYDRQECTDDTNTNSEDCSQDEMDNNGNSQIDEEGEECEKCFVCVYGEDNEGEKGYLKGQCQTLWEKARRDRGVDRKHIISADDFPEGLPDLRGCHPDLTVELISHGVPGEQDAFVSAWEDIVDVAPQCTMGDMQLRVNNCSNFAVSGGAIRNAKEVAKRYAQRGYTGTLTVTGNQYLTGYYVRTRLGIRDALGRMWQPTGSVPADAILLPFRIYGTVALPFRTVREKIHKARDPGVASQNSWLQLNICSEGVQCILPPCKKAGEIVKVDLSTNVSAGAVTMVACSHNGKRANQDCKPIVESMGVEDCELLEPVLCSN